MSGTRPEVDIRLMVSNGRSCRAALGDTERPRDYFSSSIRSGVGEGGMPRLPFAARSGQLLGKQFFVRKNHMILGGEHLIR
jgi:hypothetical protein